MTITDNTFAAACYDQNSIDELQAALSEPADARDMATWGISEAEYFESLRIALAAKRADI